MVTKSIIYQVLRALSYLHNLPSPTAHRDIKPRNVLITPTGLVQLIDFGIAYNADLCSSPRNLWPEKAGRMYHDVATG